MNRERKKRAKTKTQKATKWATMWCMWHGKKERRKNAFKYCIRTTGKEIDQFGVIIFAAAAAVVIMHIVVYVVCAVYFRFSQNAQMKWMVCLRLLSNAVNNQIKYNVN